MTYACILRVEQVIAGVREAEEILGARPWGSAPVTGVIHKAHGRLLAPSGLLQPQAANLHHATAGKDTPSLIMQG